MGKVVNLPEDEYHFSIFIIFKCLIHELRIARDLFKLHLHNYLKLRQIQEFSEYVMRKWILVNFRMELIVLI